VPSRTLLAGLLLAALIASCAAPPPSGTPAPRTPPPATAERDSPLAEAVNRYRVAAGLPRIARSAQLDRVAAAHVADLEAHYRKNARCNMHSWSADGAWSSCCYTDDHAKKECMWNKPREISRGAYDAIGYEIVAYYSDTITPARALEIWRGSPGHHAMILNRAQWADNTWLAMGTAMGPRYAVVWFAEAKDVSHR